MFRLCSAVLTCVTLLLTTPLLASAADDEYCAALSTHTAVVRRERKEWKTPFPADGETVLKDWDTTCRDWQKRHHRAQVDAADIEYALERAGLRSRRTTDCVSTWDHRLYSSRLTTTCTSY